MPRFSSRSLERLETCDPRLQAIFNVVIRNFDCTILEGYRGEEAQNEAYRAGKSTLKYPESKHNRRPSLAVDVAPYPIDWDDTERFYYFGGYVVGIADSLRIDVRWGGDWDSDTLVHDQSFFDLPHFEAREPEEG